MNSDAIDDELLNPANLKENLLNLGLKKVELDSSEFLLAINYALKYNRLSKYDTIALAIAKNRKITLLTGDGRLREAAKKEFVNVVGTLGILDMLYAYEHISEEEYDECLNELKKRNNAEVRLPGEEIERRLSADFKPYIKGALNLKI
jgi:predicted nucleic acid-binding protein